MNPVLEQHLEKHPRPVFGCEVCIGRTLQRPPEPEKPDEKSAK